MRRRDREGGGGGEGEMMRASHDGRLCNNSEQFDDTSMLIIKYNGRLEND